MSGLYLVNRAIFKVLTGLVTPIYARKAAFRFSLRDLIAGRTPSKNLDAANGRAIITLAIGLTFTKPSGSYARLKSGVS